MRCFTVFTSFLIGRGVLSSYGWEQGVWEITLLFMRDELELLFSRREGAMGMTRVHYHNS